MSTYIILRKLPSHNPAWAEQTRVHACDSAEQALNTYIEDEQPPNHLLGTFRVVRTDCVEDYFVRSTESRARHFDIALQDELVRS